MLLEADGPEDLKLLNMACLLQKIVKKKEEALVNKQLLNGKAWKSMHSKNLQAYLFQNQFQKFIIKIAAFVSFVYSVVLFDFNCLLGFIRNFSCHRQ